MCFCKPDIVSQVQNPVFILDIKINSDGNVLDKGNSPFGGLIFADNKFICYGTTGDVALFNYKDGKLVPGGTFEITLGSKEHFSHPAVADGVLYIRQLIHPEIRTTG
jgi:outer membrane protein assembly factor BamB